MLRYVIIRELGSCDVFYNEMYDEWISDSPTLYLTYKYAEETISLKNLQSSTTRIRRVEIVL